VKKRKAFSLTLEQADAHQRRHGFKPLYGINLQQSIDETLEKLKARKLRIGKRKMNQTELEFQAMLIKQKTEGKILDFRFEGVRLGWGDGMIFKPDFTVISDLPAMFRAKGLRLPPKELSNAAEGAGWRNIRLIEVKGVHVWKHAIVRFKGCRAEWKDCFTFEFWQRGKNGQWTQLA
jgi:hypothetical protein